MVLISDGTSTFQISLWTVWIRSCSIALLAGIFGEPFLSDAIVVTVVLFRIVRLFCLYLLGSMASCRFTGEKPMSADLTPDLMKCLVSTSLVVFCQLQWWTRASKTEGKKAISFVMMHTQVHDVNQKYVGVPLTFKVVYPLKTATNPAMMTLDIRDGCHEPWVSVVPLSFCSLPLTGLPSLFGAVRRWRENLLKATAEGAVLGGGGAAMALRVSQG